MEVEKEKGLIYFQLKFLFLFIKSLGYCSARDWELSGLLEENPQSGCTEIRASLKGPL